MINHWNAADLQSITKGKWHNGLPDGMARDGIEFDHRLLTEDGFFLALKGERRDGHEFVKELRQSQWALVEQSDDSAKAAQLVVDDVLGALGRLAKQAMTNTRAQKIAVTGSVGKTGTKEALAHCLSAYGKTHYSTGSFNNHLGAPLSMARAPDEAEFIIMEMGMNHAGEITPLSHLFTADIAIITKIAASHIGFFNSTDDIAAAKAEIFDGMNRGTAILPYDDDYFDYLAKRARAKGLKIISFGKGDGADIQLIDQQLHSEGQTLKLAYSHGESQIKHIEIKTGLHAAHYASTVMIVAAILHELGLDIKDALAAFETLSEMKGRGNHSQIKLANGHSCLLIDDSYNAGPASMKAALSYVKSLPYQRKALILTDMLELGDISDKAHQDLRPLLQEIAPDILILAGPYMSALAPHFEGKCRVYCGEDARAMTEKAGAIIDDCELLLIKGSHGSGAHHFASYFTDKGHMKPAKGGL